MRMFELMMRREEQLLLDLYIHRASIPHRRRPFGHSVVGVLEQSSRPDYPHLPWHDITKASYRRPPQSLDAILKSMAATMTRLPE